MIGMAEGLKYSLARGVTHRDIKGTNILISNTGVAKLVDFGLATMQGDETKPGVKSQRTVDYSALERTCNSPKGDPRSDIYFLGCVFYQMMTGQLPMEESESKDMLRKMLKRSFGAIKPINEHRYAPDEELGRIIEKMMKMDLKARYQTMDEVVTDLERYQASLNAAKAGGATADSAEDQDDLFVDSIFTMPEVPKSAGAGSRRGRRESRLPRSRPCRPRASSASRRRPRSRTPSARLFEHGISRDAGLRCRAGRRACIARSPVDAVIFDTDGQGAESIDAFIDMHETAHEEGHQLVALVLLGPKQDALKEKLPTDDRLIVLSKPIKMKQVQDAHPPARALSSEQSRRRACDMLTSSLAIYLFFTGERDRGSCGSTRRLKPGRWRF